jgi:hypothetical protein
MGSVLLVLVSALFGGLCSKLWLEQKQALRERRERRLTAWADFMGEIAQIGMGPEIPKVDVARLLSEELGLAERAAEHEERLEKIEQLYVRIRAAAAYLMTLRIFGEARPLLDAAAELIKEATLHKRFDDAGFLAAFEKLADDLASEFTLQVALPRTEPLLPELPPYRPGK